MNTNVPPRVKIQANTEPKRIVRGILFGLLQGDPYPCTFAAFVRHCCHANHRSGCNRALSGNGDLPDCRFFRRTSLCQCHRRKGIVVRTWHGDPLSTRVVDALSFPLSHR